MYGSYMIAGAYGIAMTSLGASTTLIHVEPG